MNLCLGIVLSAGKFANGVIGIFMQRVILIRLIIFLLCASSRFHFP